MQFGVHSEIGKLKKVMVSRPSLAHARLTPGNCHDLLFDDVIWVQKARSDHADFVLRISEVPTASSSSDVSATSCVRR